MTEDEVAARVEAAKRVVPHEDGVSDDDTSEFATHGDGIEVGAGDFRGIVEPDVDVRGPVLTARGVRKWLGGNEILKGVDLDVASHEVVAIVGPSGAGKSTFLRCLNLLERPEQGDIAIEGVSMTSARKADLPKLRARLGMVFQSFNLFPHLTAEQNIALAPTRVLRISRAEAKERAHDLLRRVGLSQKAGAYPRELSGGQQQRIAIARALAMHPRVMLFDEPTSALDAETVHEVVSVMRQLSESGMTMVVVSHEVGFVREACSRLLFMDEGLILAEATPRVFFDEPPNARAREFVSKIL